MGREKNSRRFERSARRVHRPPLPSRLFWGGSTRNRTPKRLRVGTMESPRCKEEPNARIRCDVEPLARRLLVDLGRRSPYPQRTMRRDPQEVVIGAQQRKPVAKAELR